MYTIKLKNQEKIINERQKKLLDTLLFLFRKYKIVYASQTRLGEIIDYCRQTVNMTVQELAEMGLIIKTNRGPHKTCLYAIPEELLTKKFRKLHAAILTTLLWSNSAFAKYVEKTLPMANPTEIKIENIYKQKEDELLGLSEENKSFFERWATVIPENRNIFDRIRSAMRNNYEKPNPRRTILEKS